jgi:hypothetical protein
LFSSILLEELVVYTDSKQCFVPVSLVQLFNLIMEPTLSNLTKTLTNFIFLSPAGQSCTSPENKEGTCIKFKDCPKLFKLGTTKPISPKNREFLRKSQCAFMNRIPYVCCVQDDEPATEAPEPETTTVAPQDTEPEWLKQLKTKVPQPPHCGADAQDRIFGGTVTDVGEFPWAVLLEYDKREVAFVLHSA